MSNCGSLVGEGRNYCWITYSIDEDGCMTVDEVQYEGIEVIGLLTEDQISDIEAQCWKHAEQEAKESELDRGEDLYNERMAYV